MRDVPRFNRGGSEKGERAGVERRRREGKEKVEGMTEGRERMGIAPLLLGGIDATANPNPMHNLTLTHVTHVRHRVVCGTAGN